MVGHRAGLRAPLGAPGIDVLAPEPLRRVVGVRRDVAGFLGVAPRGPARLPVGRPAADDDLGSWLATVDHHRTVPVTVTSWAEYRHHFGGFEGPGRLPYAVSAFFANGGRQAEVARIVHDDGPLADPLADRAAADLGALATAAPRPLRLLARSEGTWGNRLRFRLRFRTRPLLAVATSPFDLEIDASAWVPADSVLRLRLPGDVRVLRHVDASVTEPDPLGPGRRRHVRLSAALPAPPLAVEVVTGSLEVVDDDPTWTRIEVLDDLGLGPAHPRWLARVVVAESELLWPHPTWVADRPVLPDPGLAPVESRADDGGPRMRGGVDRWSTIVPEDFWDPSWTPGDERVGDGVQCLAEHDDLGLLVLPDLYDPAPLPDDDDVSDPPTLCGADFAVHVDAGSPPPTVPVTPGLLGLALDPSVPADLDRIVAAQQAVLDHVVHRRDLTLLLDVPPGLSHQERLAWRARFDSPHAAAYHPWLDVASPTDTRDRLVMVNPAAFAAGIIAEREVRLGVQHGPANEEATGAVRLATAVGDDEHDELHLSGVNVFRAERAGITLTAARTLARDPSLRQLSVARLLTILRLSLQREMQWAVFEPNGRHLWVEVRRLVHSYLTRLYDAGAFRGATTKEAFFVRCDETTMTRADLDAGRMICLVGVAPAEPIEHLLLEIARESDGSVRVETAG